MCRGEGLQGKRAGGATDCEGDVSGGTGREGGGQLMMHMSRNHGGGKAGSCGSGGRGEIVLP